MSHNYIGHIYIGHNYIGHNYIGHNYTGVHAEKCKPTHYHSSAMTPVDRL